MAELRALERELRAALAANSPRSEPSQILVEGEGPLATSSAARVRASDLWPVASSYLPVLSQDSTLLHWDIAIPHGQSFFFGELEAAMAKAREERPWIRRCNAALFRGQSTCDVDDPGRRGWCPRIMVACLSAAAGELNSPCPFAPPLFDARAALAPARVALDAGLTSIRILHHVPPSEEEHRACVASLPPSCPRAVMNGSHLAAAEMPLEEATRYRYALQMDGIAYSHRFIKLLALGTTIVRQRTLYDEPWDAMLEEGRHLAGFDCTTPAACEASLRKTMRTLGDDPPAAMAMAEASHAFGAAHLAQPEGISCFFAALMPLLQEGGLLPSFATHFALLRSGAINGESKYAPPGSAHLYRRESMPPCDLAEPACVDAYVEHMWRAGHLLQLTPEGAWVDVLGLVT